LISDCCSDTRRAFSHYELWLVKLIFLEIVKVLSNLAITTVL
jgi:hypothetical protein